MRPESLRRIRWCMVLYLLYPSGSKGLVKWGVLIRDDQHERPNRQAPYAQHKMGE